MEIALGILAIVAVLVLLVVAPSRAGMWEAAEHFCCDHKMANRLIDARSAKRKQRKPAAESQMEVV